MDKKGKRSRRSGFSFGDISRIILGIALLCLSGRGIYRAIHVFTSRPASTAKIIIGIFTIIVCLGFVLIGLVMVFGWIPVKKTRRAASKRSKKDAD